MKRCCQTNHNLSPIGEAIPYPLSAQAMRFRHSAKAAELLGLTVDELAFEIEMTMHVGKY